MAKKFYITTPIYYVNSVPHIGSAYTTIAADIFARWHKMSGDKTFFLTGTDEHGAKVAAKAKEEGKEPQQFVNEIAAKYQAAWQNLNINYDRFVRTSEENHLKAVQTALQYMYNKGDIYQGRYEGFYCRGCEQFKSERDLIDGKCADHGTVPEKMSEDCYMFKLSKYQKKILAKIKSGEFKILPQEKKNEIIAFYEKEGLNDIAFSRKNVSWGIPLPWDKAQTAYVWADAFLNYLTGLGWDGSNPPTPLSKGGAGGLKFWPPSVQLMSKDILRVHATIWPAMLLSLELPLPQALFIHGFLLVDSKKMSKSLGNVIKPEEMIKRYGVDGTRYLLISATPFGNDGDISWNKFDEKYNADLANGLGNLVARVSNLLEKNQIATDLSGEINKKLNKKAGQALADFRPDLVLSDLWLVLKKGDEKISQEKPWQMEDKNKIKKVLQPIAQDILDAAKILEAFLPQTAEKIIKQFSQKIIKKEAGLFPRI